MHTYLLGRQNNNAYVSTGIRTSKCENPVSLVVNFHIFNVQPNDLDIVQVVSTKNKVMQCTTSVMAFSTFGLIEQRSKNSHR